MATTTGMTMFNAPTNTNNVLHKATVAFVTSSRVGYELETDPANNAIHVAQRVLNARNGDNFRFPKGERTVGRMLEQTVGLANDWVPSPMSSTTTVLLVLVADTSAIDTSHAMMDGLIQIKTTMPRTRSSLSTVNVVNKPNASMSAVCEKQWYKRNQETIRGEKGKKHFDFA